MRPQPHGSRPPGDEIITRLKNLIRETEARFGTNAVVASHPTRLEDQAFPHLMPTPFGSVPVFEVEFPSWGPPRPIPGPLAAAWKVDAAVMHLIALDLETAATVGGSREIPFVIGLAWNDGEVLRLEQIVMRGMEDEGAALWALQRHMATSSHLVTYNGSRFDLPLLDRRSKVLGRGGLVPPTGAIDLEPLARDVYGRQGISSRLALVEDRVMAMVRPAWTWHPIWRECEGLPWRRRRHLARILAKNGQDTLSLLVLLRLLCDLVENPGSNARLSFFIGRTLESVDPSEARRWYRRAAQGTVDDTRLRAAVALWRLEGPSDEMAAVLAEGARGHLSAAWEAAERLGMHALRTGDAQASLRWSEEALRHDPPARAAMRIRRRLERVRAGITA
ncbi:ribonuclease H-like domain-containing protein [Candidatus Fermentibacteria bacterium]|nr:ribonuclease H-like domain-containing protein [Candidatus Fermentibacteria bacterium]